MKFTEKVNNELIHREINDTYLLSINKDTFIVISKEQAEVIGNSLSLYIILR